MMAKTIKALAEETLTFINLSGVGCFVTNAAAEELRKHGDEALPVIEETIRQYVLADSDTVADHNELLGRHLGLLNLWITYFQIGADRHMNRVISFLQSLDGPVLATAILAVNPIWPDENGKITIPTLLLRFIHETAETATGCVAEVARYYLPYRPGSSGSCIP